MKNNSSKTKVVSCRVSLEMYDLIKKCDIDLYDALMAFLSRHTEKELIQCYLTEYEQKLSELKKEQSEVEKKINELKARLES